MVLPILVISCCFRLFWMFCATRRAATLKWQDTCAAWVPHFAPTAPSKQLGDLVAHSSDRRWKNTGWTRRIKSRFIIQTTAGRYTWCISTYNHKRAQYPYTVHKIGMLSDILMIIWSPLWLFSKYWHILALRFLPPSHANVCECASKCLKVEDSRLPLSFKINFAYTYIQWHMYIYIYMLTPPWYLLFTVNSFLSS